jgi:hypothetical protein
MLSQFPHRVLLQVALLGAALPVFCAPAHAQRVPRFGINGGVFFPSNSKTKDVFGSRFISIGPGFGETQVYQRKIYPDLDFLREKRGGDRATVIFAGAKLLIPIGRPIVSESTVGFAPYSGIGVNLTYANINAPSVGVQDKGFGVGASAILGASFGGRFFTEGRYRLSTSAADFNFSGIQLVIGARF